jgi:integrase
MAESSPSPPRRRRKRQSGGHRPKLRFDVGKVSDSDSDKDEIKTKGPALPLEAHEIGPWLDCVRRYGGSRGDAGLKHAAVEFFKLRGALRPSEALQLVPANFQQRENGMYYLSIQDNGFEGSATGKLVRRTLPLDNTAAHYLDALFSEEGLCVEKQKVKWERGSKLPCFLGGAPGRVLQTPVTIQAHNQALSKAARVFAEERNDEALLHISGHSMRRTAVHLFEANKVPYSVGMQFTGHKSVEVYMQYASQPSIRILTEVARKVFTTASPNWLEDNAGAASTSHKSPVVE